MKAKYSIIVPVFNEQETVEIFYDAITREMDKLNEPYEIIYVNDGSRDNTAQVLKDLSTKHSIVKVINFSRNFGQMAAIFAGFEHSSGDAVVCIDVDLQDPVEAIPEMIAKWKQGYDIVHGKRLARKGETFFKKFTSKMYLKFLRKISGLDIPQNVGEFKLMDRKVIDTLISLPEHDRSVRGLAAWVGFKQTSVEFIRNERVAGTTKYSIKKMFKFASKNILSMSTWPLTLSMKAGIVGGVLSVACFLTFIIMACCKVCLPLAAWILPTLTLLFSANYVFNGLSNIYMTKIYEEVQNRPRYIVSELINFDNK